MLFWLSLSSLLVELICIRWLSVEVNLFAHLRNFVLVACLFGLGLGYARPKPRLPLSWTPLGLALLVAAISLPLPTRVLLTGLSGWVTFESAFSYQPARGTTHFEIGIGLLVACALLTYIGSLFVPMGQALSLKFEEHPSRLKAYLVNLVGSLAGVLIYTALSALSVPPSGWFAAAYLTMLLTMTDGKHKLACAGLGIVAFVAPLYATNPPAVSEVHWSPYQRVRLWGFHPDQGRRGRMNLNPRPQGGPEPQMWLVEANGVGLWILDMSKGFFERNAWLKPPGRIDFYDLPYMVYPNPERVLILGAGGGNDTAAALRGGARSVDAVELDPYHAELGRRLHPEKPYQDPRVQLHITDARNFLKETQNKYDIVSYSLLDNINLTSNYSNLRLDSYVYTRESLRDARAHLKPGGLLVMYAGNSSPFANRMGALIKEVMEEEPAIFDCPSQYLFQDANPLEFLAGNPELVHKAFTENPELAAFAARTRLTRVPTDQELPTDDWPYWTLERRGIPSLQVITSLLFVGIGLILVRLSAPKGDFRWNYFFLGAGFMLLEAHVITKMSLLFGCTWMVNAVVISGVLLMVILANIWVLRFPRVHLGVAYGGLLLCLILQGLFPPDRFLGASFAWLAVLFYTLPIVFAGLIFSTTFRDEEEPGAALGANLFGSVVGGTLDVLSYAIGMRAQVAVLALLYVAAWMSKRK